MESFDESLKYLLHEEPADFLRWSVVEAEDVPTERVKSYIKEAQLMESALYKSIFAQGEARGVAQGVAQGEAKARASTIYKVLVRWLGPIDTAFRQRVVTFPNGDVIAAWHDEALDLNDAESARKLFDKILHTPIPPPAEGSTQAA